MHVMRSTHAYHTTLGKCTKGWFQVPWW